jgi:hypothetical protein
MALNGSIGWSSGGTYNSWGVLVTWSAKQNIAGNYSDVTASVSIRSTNSGSWFQLDTDIWLSIDGNSDHKIFGNLLLNPNSTVPNVYTRTVRVPHDPGGGKSFALSASMSNAIVGTVSVSGSGDLTGIPRASSMTWDSSTFPHTFGKATAMNVTSAVGSYYHSVEFRLNGTLIGAPLMNSQGGGRKEFTIPIDWASRLPDSTIANCSFRLITHTKPGSYASDSLIGFKDYSGQVSVPDSMQPTISSVTYTDQNAIVKNITGSDQILVQGKSIPQMAVSSSSVYGATIRTWKFEWGSQSYTHIGSTFNIDLSQTPSLSGSQTVKVTVTDSRGRTATMNDTLDIRPYTPPTITKLTADRLADPTTTMSLVKTVSVSSIKNGTTEKNTYTVVTRYKKSTTTAWITAKTESNTSANFQMTGFAVDSSYDIDVTVTDRFGSYASKVTVSTITTLMDFYRYIGVGIGKMYESGHGALDVGGMIWMNGRSLLDTFYPIGSIYQSVNSANPSTFMGGTWIRIAQGQTLVGVDESDADFNAPSKVGGEKAHKLTTAEMPSHRHGSSDVSFMVRQANNTQGLVTNPGTQVGLYSMPTTGGDQAHNNLQPYTTVYMWRRTA